ncbi:hypothetical protein NP493_1638g00001 [Ridgeia piscesae]|uniref:Zinc finger CCCH domain-containing protein 14 n=1 Tax=Ridgeia piscesae TaxID=27915 RepID=A0AAD9JYJ8_RIDPI|nr:hypothetical protein NP493_1638g00001 [Ridgeia piscesae]
MEIGTEISKKIRAAIKAKLVELGAYVDDELPDYIMVMVANKKTCSQMTDDLSLFLGNNTTKFTAWLSALLEKLQTITTNEVAVPQAPVTATVTNTKVADEKKTEAPQVVTSRCPPVNPEPPSAAPPVMVTDEDDTEPVIRLRPEFNDEFGEDEKTDAVATPPTSPPKKENVVTPRMRPDTKPVSPPSVRTVTIHSNVAPPPSSVDRIEEEYKPQPVQRKPVSRVSPKTVDSASPDKVSPGAVAASRKRRLPGSAIGAVLKHDIYDDDEYDPYNPFVGSVASVVKVTERKSSVPKPLQANKSLLFRAMSDAQQSIEQASRRRTGNGSVRPPIASSTPESEVGCKRARFMYRTGGERIPRPRPRYTNATYTPTPTTPQSVAPLYSRSSRDDPRRQLHVSAVQARNTDQGFWEEGSKMEEGLFDSRTVQSHDTPPADVKTARPRLNLTGLDVAGILLSRPPDDATSPLSPKFVVTLDGADPRLLQKDISMFDSDEDMASDGGEWDGEGEGMGGVIGGSNVVRVMPQRAARQSPDFSTIEGDRLVESCGKFQRRKRCTFWPKCKSGDRCKYHHPTVPCRDFRKCSFGADNCFFVHPTCKFNASCTRVNCPYTHTSPQRHQSTIPIIMQPVSVPVYQPRFVPPSGGRQKPARKPTCQFFPKCHNMDCPYEHPKMCRYGIGCRNKATCPFTHPPLPSVDKLKWSSHTNR